MGKTKYEEYEALIQIRGILKDFDPEDTYIGKAFEGCVELAKDNLRNDWMMSWRARYENRDRDAAKLDEILTKTTEKLRKSEEARVDLVKELSQKDDAIARLEDAKDQLSEGIDRMDKAIAQRDSDRQELLCRLEAEKAQNLYLKQTILELKARLYDMMTGKEVKG